MSDTPSVRSELIERLKSRDLSLTGFSAGFATLVSIAFSEQGSERILLSVPFLALTFSVIAIYHDFVILHLHLYLKRVELESWDNSPERSAYSRSPLRWIYFVAQFLVFVGASVIALLLNREACTDDNFRLIWWGGICMTLLTLGCLAGMRAWRMVKD